MLLTNRQKDAIAEVINISFSRAAKSLSELTGSRVIISVPEVDLVEVHKLEVTLKNTIKDEITSVHQIFHCSISGDALLIFDRESSKNLVNTLLKEEDYIEDLTESMKEVIIEVGNIVLSACLSMFGNLLKVQLKFTVPKITLNSLSHMIQTFEISESEIKYALIVFIEFLAEGKNIRGILILVMGLTSLEKFINEIDQLG